MLHVLQRAVLVGFDFRASVVATHILNAIGGDSSYWLDGASALPACLCLTALWVPHGRGCYKDKSTITAPEST